MQGLGQARGRNRRLTQLSTQIADTQAASRRPRCPFRPVSLSTPTTTAPATPAGGSRGPLRRISTRRPQRTTNGVSSSSPARVSRSSRDVSQTDLSTMQRTGSESATRSKSTRTPSAYDKLVRPSRGATRPRRPTSKGLSHLELGEGPGHRAAAVRGPRVPRRPTRPRARATGFARSAQTLDDLTGSSGERSGFARGNQVTNQAFPARLQGFAPLSA
jgi:hypothetical protein